MATKQNKLDAVAARLAHCPAGETVTVVTAALVLGLTTKDEMGVSRDPYATDAYFAQISGRLQAAADVAEKDFSYMAEQLNAYVVRRLGMSF